MPRVLSGIQPTADSFHLGNYLGALRNWVAMQRDYDTFFAIVDLHAITVPTDPVELQDRTRLSFAQLLACGLDPELSCIFVQSQVPQHAELAWVMQCLTGFGEASRMTQFKDKSAREGGDAASVGLFTYPILQAADILLYQADQVPVGEDQRQHLELTRDLAQRFNGRYGDTFVVPDAYIAKETARVVDLQNPAAKMSKSLPTGCLFLLDESKVIEKKIKRAVTDSVGEVHFDPVEQPGVSNLLAVIAAMSDSPIAEVTENFAGGGYGPLKQATIDVVVPFARDFAVRVADLMADRAELDRIMDEGARRAREVADVSIVEVYDRVGLRRPS
ncbi:MAG: tryptophan--tRNA ligase [Micrococcales bacterium]|nr:tryptophan--tRNA ligase [Micrococcales bacterium]